MQPSTIIPEPPRITNRVVVMAPNAPQVQIDECRIAFMAGAQHLFGSIMAIMDPEAEPTEADLKKMDLIDRELRTFADEMRARMDKPKGAADGIKED
jgi:hypothetical protein